MTVEGCTADDIAALTPDELRDMLFVDRPLTFRAGSAQILGQFRLADDRIILELAHIDGGGEGVLPFLAGIAERCARALGRSNVEWIVHALTCEKPNSELRGILERRGFAPGEYRGHRVLRVVRAVRSPG